MKTAIAVGFGVADVILLAYDFEIGQFRKRISHHVHVIQKPADDSDTYGIVQSKEGAFRGLGQALPAAFFTHALVGLDSCETMVYGIGPVFGFDLVAQQVDASEQIVHDRSQLRDVFTVYGSLIGYMTTGLKDPHIGIKYSHWVTFLGGRRSRTVRRRLYAGAPGRNILSAVNFASCCESLLVTAVNILYYHNIRL